MYRTLAVLLLTTIVAVQANSGKKLKICSVASRPFVINTGGQLGGFIVDLLEAISPIANITYSLTLQADNIYGVPKGDGSWGGLVGDVITGSCDIAAADLVITSGREQVVDFSLPFYQTQYRILSNKQAVSADTNYLVIRGGSSEIFLKTSKFDKHKAIWENILTNNGFVSSFQEGVDKVLSGHFKLITEAAYVDDALKANEGKLQLSTEIVLKKYMAFAIQLGSPLRKKLSIALAKLNENGTLDSLYSKHNL